MFGLSEADIIAWFASKAYEPMFVYSTIVFFMFASSFGLPLPEEITLISAGLVGHVAMHPELYDHPSGLGAPVNLYVLASVCFLAVVVSDVVIFMLGRHGGRWLFDRPRFRHFPEKDSFRRVQRWTMRYGYWASGIFRFTPGLRFPGHMACGMLGVPTWKFLAIDGTAALISVPTQIILIGYYGDVILANFRIVKFVILGIVAALAVYALFKKWPQWKLRFRSRQN